MLALRGPIFLAGIFGFRLLTNSSDPEVSRLEFFAGKWILILELMTFLGQAIWLCGLFWSLGPDVGSDGSEEYQAFFFGTQVGKIGLVRCGILLLLVTYRVLRSFGWRTKIATRVEPVLAFVGRYVLLKAACFFVLIGLGAANRFRLIPGLRRSSEVPLLAENWRRLRKNIWIEQVLLIVALFAVARLGLLPPPQ